MKKMSKKPARKVAQPAQGPIRQHKMMAMGHQPKILSSPKTPA